MREVAVAAAKAGGKVLREGLGGQRDIRWKTDEAGERSIVTDADLRADAAIRAVIRAAAPDHLVLSEEDGDHTASGRHLWVVDPLDGTDEFSRGAPSCCVAVAYLYDGQLSAAAVYDPFRDETFSAAVGEGAWLDDRRIGVSAVAALGDAVIAVSSPDRRRSAEAYQATRNVLDAMVAETRQVRAYGSTALEICWIACGRLEGKISLRGRAWDFMASALILQEAGGRCVGLDGRPIHLQMIGAMASNGHIHEALFGLSLAAIRNERKAAS